MKHDRDTWRYDDLVVPMPRVEHISERTGDVYRIRLNHTTITRKWSETEYAAVQWAYSVWRYRNNQCKTS